MLGGEKSTDAQAKSLKNLMPPVLAAFLFFLLMQSLKETASSYAEGIIRDQDRWIQLTPEGIASVGCTHIRTAPHCIGVRMPVSAGITFQSNVELDSVSGGRVTSCSNSEATPDGGVREILEKLEELRAQGYTRALLILDAAYQFSVSIGIYTDSAETARPEKSA